MILVLIIIASAIMYLAYRLNFKWWWIFGIIAILNPILGILTLAISDYFRTYIKGINER